MNQRGRRALLWGEGDAHLRRQGDNHWLGGQAAQVEAQLEEGAESGGRATVRAYPNLPMLWRAARTQR